MLKLFRELKIFYYVLAFIGGIVLFGYFLVFRRAYFVGLGLALFWILFCSVFFNGQARRKMNQINDWRVKECRIRDFTLALEKLDRQKHAKQLDAFIKTTLSTGYHDLGEPEKAIAVLSIPLKFSETAGGMAAELCCVNNLASSYLQLYDTEKAEPFLEQMKVLLSRPTLPPAIRSAYQQLYWDKQQIVRMIRGDYSEAQAYFRQYIETHPFRLGKVVGNFYLAKAYIHGGYMEQAKRCIRFVIENGGDTFYATQAKSFRLED